MLQGLFDTLASAYVEIVILFILLLVFVKRRQRARIGAERGLESRSQHCPANILEPWPVKKQCFDLVILSNILHAYSGNEMPHILRSAAECLEDRGVLLVHDFFREHCPDKAALTDLNMFINTYNGRVFSEEQVREQLRAKACQELGQGGFLREVGRRGLKEKRALAGRYAHDRGPRPQVELLDCTRGVDIPFSQFCEDPGTGLFPPFRIFPH